uniref:CCHC-type domain-containing protein n=1 Tax=Cannabis sativa TaxID=3483 RepID=A0A803NX04_CANSA
MLTTTYDRKTVKLPKVRDEHCREFWYENIPIFCYRCGILGHPFERCAYFLKLIGNGIDPDLPYGPKMMGGKLLNSGYDRYRYDFSKANVYPFLKRLSKKAIGQAILAINYNQNLAIGTIPHPHPFPNAESSSQALSNTNSLETIFEFPSPFSSYYPSQIPSLANENIDVITITPSTTSNLLPFPPTILSTLLLLINLLMSVLPILMSL